MRRAAFHFVMLCTSFVALARTGASAIDPQSDSLSAAQPKQIEADGLHNGLQLNPSLFSGSGPEGDEAFHSLQQLGIKTIISVDGAKPDVDRAKTYGMRYVHIPVGYNGIPRSAAMQLAKAVRELPGPIYIHCHHGKHRGPAAAAIALLCADDKCSIPRALAVMQAAGTDSRYKGLFQSVREFQRPTADELARISPKLPEIVAAAGIVQAMVTIDHSWDNLKLVQAAGWKVPKDHPDIDPPHEALQLLEGFQELRRLPEVEKRPEDFRGWMSAAHNAARELEQLLRSMKEKRAVDAREAEAAFKRINSTCTQCHAKYRDVPQPNTTR